MSNPMNHTIIETIRETEDDRAAFNLLVEYAAATLAQRYEETVEKVDNRKTEQAIEDGIVQFNPHDPNDVSQWLCEGALAHIRGRIETFDADIWLQALDGEIANRGPEVMGTAGFEQTDARSQVLYDAEIAIRNEVAYRLTDRGVFPEDTWRTERYDADTNE